MANCKSCGKEIFFLKTKKGNLIPVNAESLSSLEKDDLNNGNQRLFDYQKHKSHFSDCPNANQFRNNKNV